MPMINAEMFCRLIAYNIGAIFKETFYRALKLTSINCHDILIEEEIKKT